MNNHMRQPGASDPIWSVLAGSVLLYEGTDDKKVVALLREVARNPLVEKGQDLRAGLKQACGLF